MTNMESPFFSIIIPYYEGSTSTEYLKRALDSLTRQSYQNFEILLYHDGPKSIPFEDELDLSKYPHITCAEATAQHYKNYGHSLRDIGIKQARGEYILHFNSDNVLYDFALERIVMTTKTPRKNLLDPDTGAVVDKNSNDILIFSVVMIGNEGDGLSHWPDTRNDPSHGMILTGYPALQNAIDCMQLVMRRSLWLEYGGWYDTNSDGDGNMYQRFVKERGARYIPAVLGEHW